MTYRLEVAFKENHTWNAREEQNKAINLAYFFGCESCYKDFEFSGKKREITRNTLFIIFKNFIDREDKQIGTYTGYLLK